MKTLPAIKNQRYLIALFVLLTVISILSSFIPYFGFDVSISQAVQSINSRVFDEVMRLVSAIGNQPLMVFIVITSSLALFLSGQKREAIISSLSTAAGVLSGSLLKLIIDRPRPSAYLVNVSVWLSDKSFPSNHTVAFTIFFGFLLYVLLKRSRKTGLGVIVSIISTLLISTVGISRIYLGAHWASDVLGGYLFGLLWLLITIRIYNSQHGQR